MVVFQKKWRPLFSCNTRFEIRPFGLLPILHVHPFNDESLHMQIFELLNKLLTHLFPRLSDVSGGRESVYWERIG